MSAARSYRILVMGVATSLAPCLSVAATDGASPAPVQYEPKIPANYDKVMNALERADAHRETPSPKSASRNSVARPQVAQSAPPPGMQTASRAQAVPQPQRWYVGMNIGRSGFAGDFEKTKATIFSTGATAFRATAHAYDNLWKFYVGYWVTPRISIEGGYWKFGGPSYTADISAPSAGAFDRHFHVQALGATASYSQPISDAFAIFGKAGLMGVRASASATPPIGPGVAPLAAEASSHITSTWGIGLKYVINPAVSARVEYEYLRKVGDAEKFGTANINAWSVGLNYHF